MSNQTALLIIDVQNAMFSYEDAQIYDGDEVMNNICLLLEKARAADTPVIFIQHSSDDSEDEFYVGTETWQIHPRLARQETEPIIQKRTWDAFYQTDLELVLQKHGIKSLIIAGMQTEFCVDTTCRRAFSMGYESILVHDAHSTMDGHVLTASQIIKHHNNVLGGRFATLKSTVETAGFIQG
jgi:nicotinamidase-related amidase